jgi:hypothetical protein
MTNVNALLQEVSDQPEKWQPTLRRTHPITDNLVAMLDNMESGDAEQARSHAVHAADEMEFDNMCKGAPDPLDGQSAVARVSRAADGRAQ